MTRRRTDPRTRASRAAAFALLLLSNTVAAQSGGDEADAANFVFRAFPEADSYRRIVRDVDQPARTEIERQLPFKVHFDELGPHSLFVAYRGRRPVGLVYLRLEEAEWGLTEIAWSLTLDLRVLAFAVLRGRSGHLPDLETTRFAKLLVGRDLSRVSQLLANAAGAPFVPAGAEDLARTVLRSGVKALVVTSIVWRVEITKLQDLAMGFDAFPAAESFRRQVLHFDLAIGDTHQAVAASIVRASGTRDARLGIVARTEVRGVADSLVLCWIVDPELRVVRIAPTRSWAGDELRAACRGLEGHRLTGPPEGDNPLRPLALGLGEVLLRGNAPRGGR